MDPNKLQVLKLGKKYTFEDAVNQLTSTVYGLNLRYKAQTESGESESVYLPEIILKYMMENQFLFDYVKAETYNWERRKLEMERIYLKKFNNYRPPDPCLGAVSGMLSEIVQVKSRE